MNHPDQCYQEQFERIKTLLNLIESNDKLGSWTGITYYDLAILCFQALWSLKDWVTNDPNFGAKDIKVLSSDIHSSKVLRICADIANGTKHFKLNNPKTDFGISDVMGVHLDVKAGVCKQFIRIISESKTSEFHGIEVRDFLRIALDEWNRIIDKHYLSDIDIDV